ncbi:MAG TPA: exopolysaccharide biosynthesis polyprenyl glycosylphosphotransferase [Candidatus Binataceae bacterium]|nr:exopolysaccharide biosynthesis polyprenyl glycosylphosphotransferase [Candidatus Binataceae bacterium]
MFAGELQRQKALFAACDGLALLAAFAAALMLHDPSNSMHERLLANNPALLCFNVLGLVFLWILVFRACDLYRMRNGGLKEFIGVVRGCSYAAMLTVLIGFVAHVSVSRITVGLAYMLSMVAVAAERAATRACIRRFYANPKNAIPLVLIGCNRFAHYLCDQILDEMTPYEVIGFLGDDSDVHQYRGCPVLGPVERLSELAAVYPSLEAAIVLPEAPREQHERVIAMCEEQRLRWWMMPWVAKWPRGGLRVDMFGVVPLISPRGSNIEGLNYALKRAFDVTVGGLLLLATAPLLALSALAIRLFDDGPILFRQTRIGMRGRPFSMYKLRTMRAVADDSSHRDYVRRWIGQGEGAAQNRDRGERVFKMTDDRRITPLGRWLRRFSIDELPQLINVVRGEMSLIGPRPALPYELELYQPWHLRRLDGAPGITGLWQVSGRNQLSFDDMVRLDVHYLQSWSFVGDLRILARTVPAMLRGGGM